MNYPRQLLFGTCLLSIAALAPRLRAEVPANQLTEAEKRSGWTLLFDGKSSNGWRNYRQQKFSDGWAVRDGILAREKAGAGDILTNDQFEYFELSLEYRIASGGNSGIMFHVTEEEQAPWQTGPEVQIQDNVDGHDPQKSGWLYQLYSPLKPAWATKFEKQVGFKGIDVDDATRPPGEWNHVYLRISPIQCEVAVNGVSYFYFKKGDDDWNQRVAKSKFATMPKFGKAKRGHICLQDHGDAVAFRNIKVRTLGPDGSAPEPIDGHLPLQGVVAFPNLKWTGYESSDEQGKIQKFRPMVLTHAGDGSQRMFVATQSGQIHVLAADPEVKESQLFLDIHEKVQPFQMDDEEGLLGLAFHPRYKTTGQFFVYYSSRSEPRTSIVSRFRVSKDDPNRADPASEEVVLKIPQPFSNHNGGSIVFGHDGYLYIALGDGGGRNDPLQHGQNLQTWMGSILRIDVDHSQDQRPYAIPKDNPFLDRTGAQPEIFAYGFRNVWRLSVDRQTGTLWAGDVGQDLWEEIDIVRRGANYGWSIREGSYPFGNGKPTNPDPLVEPIWEYDHQIGKSITGGFVYRGKKFPELFGAYLYADYVTGRIWALYYDESSGKVIKNLSIIPQGIPVLAFGEDEQGEAYYLMETVDGRSVYRFERK